MNVSSSILYVASADRECRTWIDCHAKPSTATVGHQQPVANDWSRAVVLVCQAQTAVSVLPSCTLGRMNPKVILALAIGVVCVGAAPPSMGLCIDPTTLQSGYKIPLTTEVRNSRAIVIGRVVKVEARQEDRDDPTGVTANVYTVQVIQTLKGNPPSLLSVREENDSGRYSMALEETHLLFLQIDAGRINVDSCGNSSSLPAGNAMLAQVERTMGETVDKQSNHAMESRPSAASSQTGR